MCGDWFIFSGASSLISLSFGHLVSFILRYFLLSVCPLSLIFVLFSQSSIHWGAEAHQMNDSVSFSSSLQGFFRPHTRRSVAGRWLAIQFSPPLSGRHFALISSPSDAERRKFGQANGKTSDKKKAPKNQQKIQKMKQKIYKTRHRCVSLFDFCSVVVIELFSLILHVSFLFSLALSTLKKKKYCKYIRKIRHPNITLYLSLNDLSKPWLSTELAYLKV